MFYIIYRHGTYLDIEWKVLKLKLAVELQFIDSCQDQRVFISQINFIFLKLWIQLTSRVSGFPSRRTFNDKSESICSQFYQHFMSSFFANFLLPKNYNPKLKTFQSGAKHSCSKSCLLVKYWWNWHLDELVINTVIEDKVWKPWINQILWQQFQKSRPFH